MKKLWNILVLTLAMNFLAAAGGIAWLVQTGKLDKVKIHSIREIVFPPPVPEEEEKEEPAADPTTQPALRLEELLARAAGRTATEQVDFIQQAFDAQLAQLDRRQRELNDLQRAVDLAKKQLSEDRQALTREEEELKARQELATKLETDQGFQDSLELYKSMPGRQVKSIFLQLEDDIVIRYLQSMEPRAAQKIIKEFKTPEELQRIQRVLEKMRQAQASIEE